MTTTESCCRSCIVQRIETMEPQTWKLSAAGKEERGGVFLKYRPASVFCYSVLKEWTVRPAWDFQRNRDNTLTQNRRWQKFIVSWQKTCVEILPVFISAWVGCFDCLTCSDLQIFMQSVQSPCSVMHEAIGQTCRNHFVVLQLSDSSVCHTKVDHVMATIHTVSAPIMVFPQLYLIPMGYCRFQLSDSFDLTAASTSLLSIGCPHIHFQAVRKRYNGDTKVKTNCDLTPEIRSPWQLMKWQYATTVCYLALFVMHYFILFWFFPFCHRPCAMHTIMLRNEILVKR